MKDLPAREDEVVEEAVGEELRDAVDRLGERRMLMAIAPQMMVETSRGGYPSR